MSDIISASHDVVFKALFVRNQDILRVFLCDMLDLKLTDEDEVIVLNPELIPELSDGKLSRLDIHVKMADRKFNIEMQVNRTGFSVERVLYYWSKMFIGDFRTGEKYPDLEQAYSINILDFNYFDNSQYQSSYAILEENRFQKITEKLSIHIFELPKVPKEMVPGDKKQMWMELIKADSKEALEMIKTKTQNPAIQKGADAVYELNVDTVIREQILQREKALNDYYNDLSAARSEGIAEGRKEGRLALLKQLVQNGILTVSQAAKESNMTSSDFIAKTGLDI